MSTMSRGQVWNVNLSPSKGAEMYKIRPCVIVSSDYIGRLPLKVVVPITEWDPSYEGAPWFVQLEPNAENGLDKLSGADAFQVKSLSVERFEEKRGVLSEDEVEDIVAAIAIVVQINL
ncbi:type II toxin-antitoxin system PemK/MazF family toxin [Paludifilum halophilum]|nr:type II toxin-antitoxin system PemK/MazF family toxin [Paludifilum halophilum]